MSADVRSGPSLGQYIKAHRLRFGAVPHLQAYMRLTIVGEDVFRAELVPPDQLPARPGPESHVLWYTADGDQATAAELRMLCARVVAGELGGRLRKRVAFLFDGDGQFIGWAT